MAGKQGQKRRPAEDADASLHAMNTRKKSKQEQDITHRQIKNTEDTLLENSDVASPSGETMGPQSPRRSARDATMKSHTPNKYTNLAYPGSSTARRINVRSKSSIKPPPAKYEDFAEGDTIHVASVLPTEEEFSGTQSQSHTQSAIDTTSSIDNTDHEDSSDQTILPESKASLIQENKPSSPGGSDRRTANATNNTQPKGKAATPNSPALAASSPHGFATGPGRPTVHFEDTHAVADNEVTTGGNADRGTANSNSNLASPAPHLTHPASQVTTPTSSTAKAAPSIQVHYGWVAGSFLPNNRVKPRFSHKKQIENGLFQAYNPVDASFGGYKQKSPTINSNSKNIVAPKGLGGPSFHGYSTRRSDTSVSKKLNPNFAPAVPSTLRHAVSLDDEDTSNEQSYAEDKHTDSRNKDPSNKLPTQQDKSATSKDVGNHTVASKPPHKRKTVLPTWRRAKPAATSSKSTSYTSTASSSSCTSANNTSAFPPTPKLLISSWRITNQTLQYQLGPVFDPTLLCIPATSLGPEHDLSLNFYWATHRAELSRINIMQNADTLPEGVERRVTGRQMVGYRTLRYHVLNEVVGEPKWSWVEAGDWRVLRRGMVDGFEEEVKRGVGVLVGVEERTGERPFYYT